jgi:hypothetical protein
MLVKPVQTISLVTLLLIFSTQCAFAYVDPGVTGMLFQMGYVVFYGALAVLAAFFRPLKIFFLTLKSKLFGKKNSVSEVAETKSETEPE